MDILEANRILASVHNKKDKLELTPSDADKIRSARSFFIDYYSGNPRIFIKDFVKIISGTTNEEIPFVLNAAQESLVEALDDTRYVAAPKARQLGITTLTNALALHHVIFSGNARVIVMATVLKNAQNNLRNIKKMFKSLPLWVQNVCSSWSEDKGHQNNLSLWSFHSKIVKTDCSIEVASGEAESATRGNTPTFLHWTETAFNPSAEEVFTAIFPALNRRKDSIIILESTGNGNSGFYYEVCLGIRKGFKVVFLPWNLDEDYSIDGEDLTEADLENIQELLGVSEIPDYLSEGQLRWFRLTSEAMGKAKCQQEYPINVAQVFQATNASLFPMSIVGMIKMKEPLHTLGYENGYLVQKHHGSGLVFDKVDPEKEYIIVCDPSEGVEDPTVIGIYGPDGKETLFWREKLQVEDVVSLLNILGRQYNDSRVVIENNGFGLYIVKALAQQKFYPNMFHENGKLGFKTTASNKPEITSLLMSAIRDQKMEFYNRYLPEEMTIFQADTLRAPKGKDLHDDVVMMSSIASYIMKYYPPKLKYVRDDYRDYSSIVNRGRRTKRKFMI